MDFSLVQILQTFVAGFGLGLNYVYQVMDAHDGSVTVNSVEKEFSEFTLYVPLKA